MQTVLLIQDQQTIPAALRDALAEYYLVQIALDDAQAREMARASNVVILALTDLHAPERLSLLRECIVFGYKVLTLVLASDDALIRACIALGVHGIIHSDGEMTALLSNIETVLKGERTYVAQALASSLAFYIEHLPALPSSSMAVLNSILHRPTMCNEQICHAVQLSEGSVRNIFSTLFKKFSVGNRLALADAARQRGYFVGLHLVFPRGLNVVAGHIKMRGGKKKYLIVV